MACFPTIRGFVASLRTRTSPFICSAFKWTAPCSHARNRDSLNQFRRKYAENSKCRALFTTPTVDHDYQTQNGTRCKLKHHGSFNLLLENRMENGNNIFTATNIEKIEFFLNVFYILQVIDSRIYSMN